MIDKGPSANDMRNRAIEEFWLKEHAKQLTQDKLAKQRRRYARENELARKRTKRKREERQVEPASSTGVVTAGRLHLAPSQGSQGPSNQLVPSYRNNPGESISHQPPNQGHHLGTGSQAPQNSNNQSQTSNN